MTGAWHLDTAAVADMVPRIKAHVNVPVGVGFGIRDAETAKAVAAVSDAVVIGSRIVQLLETQTPETVVAAGRATGLAMFGSLSPVAGDQLKVYGDWPFAPEPVSCWEDP